MIAQFAHEQAVGMYVDYKFHEVSSIRNFDAKVLKGVFANYMS